MKGYGSEEKMEILFDQKKKVATKMRNEYTGEMKEICGDGILDWRDEENSVDFGDCCVKKYLCLIHLYTCRMRENGVIL